MKGAIASSSLDPWTREISDASKLAEEVNEMLGQRNSLPVSGPQTQRHMSTTRRKMTILRTKLESLHSLLPDLETNHRITAREMNRRRDILSSLSLKAGEMAPMLNMSLSADRENLLGLKQNDVMKVAELLDNNDLVGFQRQIIKDQDAELAKLEETVVSTKHIALAVNEELDLHTRLIENIDEHVDSTYSRLQRLKGRLSVLSRKTKGGCSSVILLILTVGVLIIVIWGLLKYL